MWMPLKVRNSMTAYVPNFLLALLLIVFRPVAGSAQPNHQRLLDSAVVANGVLPGYFTASGEHVLRMQFGPALEMHRYAADGTALWWNSYAVEGTAWNTSVVISDGAEGAVLLGNATVVDREGPDPRLVVMHMAVDGDGVVQQSALLEYDLDAATAAEFQPVPRLVRASDGAVYMIVASVDLGHPQLLIVKRSQEGVIEWARGLGDAVSGPDPPWGDPATLVCGDGAAGLYAVRRDLGSTSLLAARIGSDGSLLWMKRFEDPAGYAVETYDIASSVSGDLLVLGRMLGTGLPSGGTLQSISPQGDLMAWTRYQWDIGRRLFVLADGSMAAVKIPGIYRLDATAAVLWVKAFEDWMIDPHHYIFAMTNMEVQQGRLWMQGVLRRILVQFNTQRLLPAFATHPLDSIEGCQWAEDIGFGSTSLDVSTVPSTSISNQLMHVLDDRVGSNPMVVSVADPGRRELMPFCDQVVSVPAIARDNSGFRVLANPVERGTAIEVRDASPGVFSLTDAQGRLLWQYRLNAAVERVALPSAPQAAGVNHLRWVPVDGSLGATVKVLVY